VSERERLNSSVYAAFGTLFIQHLHQLCYPSLLLVPDNRWDAHGRIPSIFCSSTGALAGLNFVFFEAARQGR
jgi:hypothetical protein